MQSTEKHCPVCGNEKKIKPKFIYSELISVDDPNQMREDLREMFEAYIMQEHIPRFELRDKVHSTYSALMRMLLQVKMLNDQPPRL